MEGAFHFGEGGERGPCFGPRLRCRRREVGEGRRKGFEVRLEEQGGEKGSSETERTDFLFRIDCFDQKRFNFGWTDWG
jgi:hypothetical protein